MAKNVAVDSKIVAANVATDPAQSGPRLRSNGKPVDPTVQMDVSELRDIKKPKKTADGTTVLPRPDPKVLAAAIAGARQSRAPAAPPSFVVHPPPGPYTSAPPIARRVAQPRAEVEEARETTLRVPAALALVAIVAFLGGAATITLHAKATHAEGGAVAAARIESPAAQAGETVIAPIVVAPAPPLEPTKTTAAPAPPKIGAPVIYKPKHGLPNPADFEDHEPVR
jgi:hypothetical protein